MLHALPEIRVNDADEVRPRFIKRAGRHVVFPLAYLRTSTLDLLFEAGSSFPNVSSPNTDTVVLKFGLYICKSTSTQSRKDECIRYIMMYNDCL